MEQPRIMDNHVEVRQVYRESTIYIIEPGGIGLLDIQSEYSIIQSLAVRLAMIYSLLTSKSDKSHNSKRYSFQVQFGNLRLFVVLVDQRKLSQPRSHHLQLSVADTVESTPTSRALLEIRDIEISRSNTNRELNLITISNHLCNAEPKK